MASRIVIERLEFAARCGVTPDERSHTQPLAVDLELDYETSAAAASDHLADTVDYARVAQRVVELGSKQDCALLEALAERLLDMLFAEFATERIALWIRKLAPPVPHVAGSVGLKIQRARSGQEAEPSGSSPSRFLMQQIRRLPKGRALDVACGSGRNALYLASRGFDVDAIDRDAEAVARLVQTARQRGLLNVNAHVVDLERKTADRPEFPTDTYDLVVVTFYLHRPLFPWLIEALKPNGVLLYETFTIDNYFRHHHPRRWEFCLGWNELLRLTSTLRVLSYDEGEHEGAPGSGLAFTARLVAQKTGPG